jgi:hypothetical protein
MNSNSFLDKSTDYPNLTDTSFKIIVDGTFKKVYFSEITLQSIEGTIRGYGNRIKCVDALYDIVCTPYSDNYELYTYSPSTKKHEVYNPSKTPTEFTKDAGLRILSSFITQYGSGQAIDI